MREEKPVGPVGCVRAHGELRLWRCILAGTQEESKGLEAGPCGGAESGGGGGFACGVGWWGPIHAVTGPHCKVTGGITSWSDDVVHTLCTSSLAPRQSWKRSPTFLLLKMGKQVVPGEISAHIMWTQVLGCSHYHALPTGTASGETEKGRTGDVRKGGWQSQGLIPTAWQSHHLPQKATGVTKSTVRFGFPDAGVQFPLSEAVLTVGPQFGTQEALLKQVVLEDHEVPLKETELCRVYSGFIGRNLVRHLKRNVWGEVADIQGLPGLNMLSHPPHPELCLWAHPTTGSGEPTPCQATWQCWGAVLGSSVSVNEGPQSPLLRK